jgi:prepilin-type N-terminal cleavage/methylation domain-containing protein
MLNNRRGFTLVEMMVVLAILMVVMSLLVFPILSAYGFIQRARAHTDAAAAGDRVMQQMKADLSAAEYIFDPPIDGSSITFIPQTSNGNSIAVATASQYLCTVTKGVNSSTSGNTAVTVDSTTSIQPTSLPLNVVVVNPLDYSQISAQLTAVNSTTSVNLAVTGTQSIVAGAVISLAPTNGGTVNIVRYMRVLNAPWDTITGASPSQYPYYPFWALANTSWQGAPPQMPLYGISGNPLVNTPENPYIIGRYASATPLTWSGANIDALDLKFPLGTLAVPSLLSTMPNSQQLTLLSAATEQLHSTLPAVTPTAPGWDITQFQVTPLRVTSESLQMQVNNQGVRNPSVYVARYPLWVGRNADLDALGNANPSGWATLLNSVYDFQSSTSPTPNVLPFYQFYLSALAPMYGGNYTGVTTTTAVSNIKTVAVNTTSGLYPNMTVLVVSPSSNPYPQTVTIHSVDSLTQITLAAPATIPANAALVTPLNNPYGYQIQIFDNAGNLVYGLSNGAETCNRHFMDWPPVDRPDWDWTQQSATSLTNPWTVNDILRQRLEGKLVGAEPMIATSAKTLTLTPDAGAAATNLAGVTNETVWDLPVPAWFSEQSSPKAYVVQPPPLMTTSDGRVFKLVHKDPFSTVASQQLQANEYCLYYNTRNSNPGDQASIQQTLSHQGTGWQLNSRVVVFGGTSSSPALPNTANVTIISASYTVCDIQPTDTVIASYSTKGVFDVALTVSRKDSVGFNTAIRHVDYPVKLRIDARNAVQHARNSR